MPQASSKTFLKENYQNFIFICTIERLCVTYFNSLSLFEQIEQKQILEDQQLWALIAIVLHGFLCFRIVIKPEYAVIVSN